MHAQIEIYPRKPVEVLIAGWDGWYNAGNVSIAPIDWLIYHLQAIRIADIPSYPHEIFQTPYTHAHFRPVLNITNGKLQALWSMQQRFYLWEDSHRAFILFCGVEPQIDVYAYAQRFFETLQALGVRHVISIGGIYAAVPYRQHRPVLCASNSEDMLKRMEQYYISRREYTGPASINDYLLAIAHEFSITYTSLTTFVPIYQLPSSRKGAKGSQKDIVLYNDFLAWQDILIRLGHMFHLPIDTTDIQREWEMVQDSIDRLSESTIVDLQNERIKASEYIHRLVQNFDGPKPPERLLPPDADNADAEVTPLDDIWVQAIHQAIDNIDGADNGKS